MAYTKKKTFEKELLKYTNVTYISAQSGIIHGNPAELADGIKEPPSDFHRQNPAKIREELTRTS